MAGAGSQLSVAPQLTVNIPEQAEAAEAGEPGGRGEAGEAGGTGTSAAWGVGAVVSSTTMTCDCAVVLPHASRAVQVRVMV